MVISLICGCMMTCCICCKDNEEEEEEYNVNYKYRPSLAAVTTGEIGRKLRVYCVAWGSSYFG